MSKATKFALGERVRVVPQHWLRGGEMGRLIRFEQRGQNNWLVKFDSSYPGGGIEGNKLWFDPRDLAIVTDEDMALETERSADGSANDLFAGDLH